MFSLYGQYLNGDTAKLTEAKKMFTDVFEAERPNRPCKPYPQISAGDSPTTENRHPDGATATEGSGFEFPSQIPQAAAASFGRHCA